MTSSLHNSFAGMIDTFDHDPVMQRAKFRFSYHGSFLRVFNPVVIEGGSEYGRIRHREGQKNMLVSLAIALSKC